MDKEEQKRSIKSALLTMAYTIAESDPVYLTYLTNTIYTMSPNISSATLYRIWQFLFVDFYSPAEKGNKAFFGNEPVSEMTNSAFLVIDGLDEALPKERMDFFRVIHEIKEKELWLRIMLISRPDVKLELLNYSEFEEIPTISFSASKSRLDNEKYINYKVDRSTRLRDLQPAAFKGEVVRRFIQGAEGMFLWVDLMIKELQQKRNSTQIQVALGNLPKGLPALYTQILTRLHNSLDEETMGDVNELLTWVLFADFPLTYRELKHALGIHNGQDLISFEDTVHRCSSLIKQVG